MISMSIVEKLKNSPEFARNFCMKYAGVVKSLGFNESDVAEFSSEAIIALAITVFIIAILVPIALNQLNNANTSGLSTEQLALYGLIGTVALLAIVIGIIKHVRG
jgi:hypothetical protein